MRDFIAAVPFPARLDLRVGQADAVALEQGESGVGVEVGNFSEPGVDRRAVVAIQTFRTGAVRDACARMIGGGARLRTRDVLVHGSALRD